MLKQMASVSIVAANYNNGKYLKDFINSVMESSVLPLELLIIDDGSTDYSVEILETFSEVEFLKVIKFKENKGFCEALNAGIEIASGNYIMRVDPDDLLLKHRIQKQYEFLEKNRYIDIVGSNVIYFLDETGEYINKSNFPLHHDDIFKTYYNGEHGVQHPSVLVRTEVMKKYSYIQKNFKSEDYDIFARMIADGHKFANISDTLTLMRVHGDSVSVHIKYETIAHTFDIRDEIFNTKTNWVKKRFYYWHILNYKRYLISKNQFKKYFYLLLGVLFYPAKIWDRIFNIR